MKFLKIKAAKKVFDDLAKSGRRLNGEICDQKMSRLDKSAKANIFKALVRRPFMQISMPANAYYSGCTNTYLHDNLPVILYYTSQEQIVTDRTWVLHGTILNKNNMFKIKRSSALKPEWLLIWGGTFFKAANFRPGYVKDSFDSLIRLNRTGRSLELQLSVC